MQNTVQLFTAQNGSLSAKAILPDGTIRHIHSLVDPAIEGVFYKDLEFWGDIIVFAGLGLGYHIAPCARNIPGNALVMAIDYYDALVEHCRDKIFSGLSNHVAYLSSGNAGDGAASAAEMIRQKPSAKIQLIQHPASFGLHRQFYETIIDRLLPAPTEPATGRSPASHRAAVRNALLMHGSFFLEEELAAALRRNRVEPVLFAYNEHPSPLGYENALMKLLQEQRPSIIVSVNMKGIDANGAFEDITRRLGIPVIVWFVDDPRRIASVESRNTFPKIIAACWEKAYIPWLEHAGFSKARYLPLASDPSLFQSASPVSPSVNVGFVGTSMVDAYAGRIKEKFLWSDVLAPLVEQASELLLANPDFDVDASLIDCAKAFQSTYPFPTQRTGHGSARTLSIPQA